MSQPHVPTLAGVLSAEFSGAKHWWEFGLFAQIIVARWRCLRLVEREPEGAHPAIPRPKTSSKRSRSRRQAEATTVLRIDAESVMTRSSAVRRWPAERRGRGRSDEDVSKVPRDRGSGDVDRRRNGCRCPHSGATSSRRRSSAHSAATERLEADDLHVVRQAPGRIGRNCDSPRDATPFRGSPSRVGPACPGAPRRCTERERSPPLGQTRRRQIPALQGHGATPDRSPLVL